MAGVGRGEVHLIMFHVIRDLHHDDEMKSMFAELIRCSDRGNGSREGVVCPQGAIVLIVSAQDSEKGSIDMK